MKPAPRSKPPAPENTEVLYGLRSGLSVFERRKKDIRRIGFEAGARSELGELLRWAQSAGVPCREESDKELAYRAESNQHEGLVLDVVPRPWLPPKELAAWLATNPGLVVALDRVRNPQNIGAILRSAAFFGANAVLLGAPAPHPGLPPFALRVAEGGAEHLTFSRTTDLADTLGRLKAAGVHIIGADTHSRVDSRVIAPHASRVLVLGNEREGLSPRIKSQCNALVGIQGSGAMESLNVAVAAGVLLSELFRQRSEGSPASLAPATQAGQHRR